MACRSSARRTRRLPRTRPTVKSRPARTLRGPATKGQAIAFERVFDEACRAVSHIERSGRARDHDPDHTLIASLVRGSVAAVFVARVAAGSRAGTPAPAVQVTLAALEERPP